MSEVNSYVEQQRQWLPVDRADHYPLLLLRLRKRKRRGRRLLGRRLQLRQQQLGLWLQLRRLQLRLWLRLRLRRQLQLRLHLQQCLLLSGYIGRSGARMRPAPLFYASRASTADQTSRWISSGVRTAPPREQSMRRQPRRRTISAAFSRHCRK